MEFYVAWLLEASSIPYVYVHIRRCVYTCIHVLLCFEVCVFYLAVLIIISASTLFFLHTHTYTHTHNSYIVVSWFYLRRCDGAEGEQVVVRLSAPILTHISTFTRSIEVDVTCQTMTPDILLNLLSVTLQLWKQLSFLCLPSDVSNGTHVLYPVQVAVYYISILKYKVNKAVEAWAGLSLSA